MRPLFLASVLLLALSATVSAQISMNQPYVVGSEGFGYVFGVHDSEGNLILATNPGVNGTAILKTFNGTVTGRAYISPSKGRVTSGCIISNGTTHYLVVGLSVEGYAARIDLSMHSDAVKYLNATDEAGLWNGESPKTLNTAFCRDNYVYFGTKSSSVNTVVRLDVRVTDPSARFRALTPLGPGDFTQVVAWDHDQLVFAMEPDTGSPLILHFITTGDNFALSSSLTARPKGFDFLSGMSADRNLQRIYITNASGKSKIAAIDVSSGQANVIEELELLTGVNPITTATFDMDARYAYLTVGDCASPTASAFIAVRLVPTIIQELFTLTDPTVLDCQKVGSFSASLLQTTAGDTGAAPRPRRTLLALTEVDFNPTTHEDGVIVPFTVFAAGSCPDNCFESKGQGYCAAETCRCSTAFNGAACNDPLPCNGTECSHHGSCVNNVCQCIAGWEGPDCSAPYRCPMDCSGRGVCSVDHCVCSEGFTGSACELHTAGCDSELLQNCHDHGTCVVGYPVGTCVCFAGFTGVACAEEDISCPGNCSAHGVCSQGVCACSSGWTGLSCSEVASPCPNACNGHGVCRNHRCTCFHGYKGLDCGTADVSLCTDGCFHGTCNNGECKCEEGWKGSNCSQLESQLKVISQGPLEAGEDEAVVAFTLSHPKQQVVFCVRTSPPKCVFLDPRTMERVRTVSLDGSSAAAIAASSMLIETAEAPSTEIRPLKTKTTLMPDLISVSSVAMVEVDSVATATVSSAVVDDSADGSIFLGTSTTGGDGNTHGQIIKLSVASMTIAGQVLFEDDSAPGVTAVTRSSSGSLYVASGSNPVKIYVLTPDLQITATASLGTSEARLLVHDGSEFIFVVSSTTVFKLNAATLSVAGTSNIISEVGQPTVGFYNNGLVFGTDAFPAAIVRVDPASFELSILRLGNGQNHVTAATSNGDIALFALVNDVAISSCFVSKVNLTAFKDVDTLALASCSSPIESAVMSNDGAMAFFGNGASPAHIYSVKLHNRTCEENCNGNGVCNDGVCECFTGFSAPLCAAAPTTTTTCPNNCSSAGSCVDGHCECRPGRTGDDCSSIEACASKCTNGRCMGADNSYPCVCNIGWTGLFCDKENTKACPSNCSSHGVCNNGTCVCSINYQGSDCSQYVIIECTINADCGGENHVCLGNPGENRTCGCASGFEGASCSPIKSAEEETAGVSPVLIGVLVVGALAMGMVAGVSIWKSWAGQSSAKSRVTVPGLGSSGSASGGYTRLRHRLTK